MISRILALGGHDFTSRPPDRAVCELMLRLATERAGGRPRICILPTASGDTSEQIGRFYAAFGERACDPSDLSLFRLGRRPVALRDHLLSQDLVYVGGGSLRQPARGLGGARARRDPQPRLAAGHRPRRPERRRDVLVRGRDHEVLGPPGRRRRPRPARRQPLRPLQQRARAPRRLPGGGRRRDAGRLRPRRLRRAALGGQRPARRRSPPAAAPAPTGSRPARKASPRRRSRPASCRRPAPATLREDIAEFRRITGDAQARRLAGLSA